MANLLNGKPPWKSDFPCCQFLTSEPRYRIFCGQPTEYKNYCYQHAKLCYQNMEKSAPSELADT